MNTPEDRLKALRRKLKRGKRQAPVVLQHPHAQRYPSDTLVDTTRTSELEQAFLDRWCAGENTFEIYASVLAQFPEAKRVEIDFAAGQAADELHRRPRHLRLQGSAA
jgi:hypothetical protein